MPNDPFNGLWELNVAASTLPFAPPRSVLLRVDADRTVLRLREDSVGADGTVERVTIRARFGELAYPVYGSALADGFAVRRVGQRVWKSRGLKSGRVAFSATLVADPGGRRFSEDAVTTLPDGTRARARLVYDRIDWDPGYGSSLTGHTWWSSAQSTSR